MVKIRKKREKIDGTAKISMECLKVDGTDRLHFSQNVHTNIYLFLVEKTSL